MPVTVDLEKCVGSKDCLQACAFNAIEVRDGKAIIFENCVDCDACVRACPTDAIASTTAPVAAKGGILVVDFDQRSGIVAVAARTAKAIGSSMATLRVDPADAGAAADAIANEVEANGHAIVLLPHEGCGPAIAARLASKLHAPLLAGCTNFSVDDSGGLRATRQRYRGLVKVTSRAPAGRAVVTLLPRGTSAFAAQTVGPHDAAEKAGDAPAAPELLARRVVAISPTLAQDTAATARACAQALGAAVIDPARLPGTTIAPDLYVAFGVEGSTEHNAAVRAAGTIIALVERESAPIATIADYLLAGDVGEHARALLAAL